MLIGLPELLCGDALLWYRNHRHGWTYWDDFLHSFREQFLSRRYRALLVQELQSRRQHDGEQYAKYATAVLTLMRRASRTDLEEQVEQLYEGLTPEYKLYIRRDDIKTLGDLSSQASEFEAIAAQS